MAEPLTGMLDAGNVNLACFEVNGTAFAIEIDTVREIVRRTEITPLPRAPELIEGIVDLRGMVIPVLDLSRALGQGPSVHGERARILILDLEGLVLGLLVDAATDVLSIESSRLEDVPDLASQAGYDAVRHVVRRPGEPPIMVLSLETLLERVYRSAIPDRAARGSEADGAGGEA
ncbi:MAG: chemotaxis protein CheW [bacterium]